MRELWDATWLQPPIGLRPWELERFTPGELADVKRLIEHLNKQSE